MDASTQSSSSAPPKSNSLFQVYLRLRPPQANPSSSTASLPAERFLAVETPREGHTAPTHITLNPPNDRRRAIEKFAFTQVFEEDASQLDLFHCTGVLPLVEGVLAPHGGDGTDALFATLGVTGSGKSHTILGSKTQRGMTQLALDVIFRSLGSQILDCNTHPSLEGSISASDPSEGAICPASAFIDSVYADPAEQRPRAGSRAPTPMIVRPPFSQDYRDPCLPQQSPAHGDAREQARSPPLHLPGAWIDVSGSLDSPKTVRVVRKEDFTASPAPSTPTKDLRARNALHNGRPPRTLRSPVKHFMAPTASARQKKVKANHHTHSQQGESSVFGLGPPSSSQSSQTPSRRLLARPAALPSQPDVSGLTVSSDPAAEYAVVVSMYEVYNDRIFDLLTPPVRSAATKEYRRRALLFKPTEASPDRKVVAGLRKVVCGTLSQALMVLEAGLHERRVAGTGSNSVSSRSHGFFCVEVKKRPKAGRRHHMDTAWGGSMLTVVDLAGSERARDAKTAGATLAEAGKINESLMYLGQCLQMQSDSANKDRPGVVPFRQCKLTELLFSNSFPSGSGATNHSSSTMAHSQHQRRNPQKAVMVVTADPHGDFNATSQILRYSALAREITVPRVPSITQTILQQQQAAAQQQQQNAYSSPLSSPDLSRSTATNHHHHHFFPSSSSGSAAPSHSRTFSSASSAISAADSATHRGTMESAALEIARLAEENEYLRSALAGEQAARCEAEARLLSVEDRMLDLEQAVREDCAAEFERRLELEMARWKAAMQVEAEREEEKWGRKLEVFAATLGTTGGGADEEEDWDEMDVGEDGGEDKENLLVEDVGQENERLRRDNEVLRRELAGMSPTKRLPLRERGPEGETGVPRAPGSGARGRPRPSGHGSVIGNGSVNGSGNGNGHVGLERKMERLRVSDDSVLLAAPGSVRSSRQASGSPTKRVRRLAAKRWEGGLDDDDLF